MEKLRGADTVVYVGSMCDDYNTMLTRDWETLPRFRFRGTNAHCVLESSPPKADTIPPCGVLFTPFTFSAASTVALRTTLSWHLQYLKANPDVGLTDLAYTLQHRRSTLPYRKAIAAPDLQTATQTLRKVLERPSNGEEDVDFETRFTTPTQPSII
ncbi:MAG: hypothetical protein LQ352_002121 [Teloschistes flavicans]|nr:MAG: hypothetical protein LQ352_002121 [Teloschistes flavicans]